MKSVSKITIIFIILVILGGGFWFYLSQRSPEPSLELPKQKELSEQKIMKLTSPAFGNNQLIPAKYTCDGQDINPPLQISEIPEGAKSLVLIVDDPDAPMGTWDHWIVWNIDPSISLIEENTVPKGAIEGLNDFGKTSYGGPCPPSGTHHYYFKLYALDRTLELDSSVKKKEVEKAMAGAILDQVELIGLYQRE
jgi:Raf kinase inhibitor-like YbhB/YbcL family protein